MAVFDALNRLAKWRRVYLAQMLGRDYIVNRGGDKGREKALINLFEKSLFLRVELNAMAAVLIKRGVISRQDWEVQLLTEIHEMHKILEKEFPGIAVDEHGPTLQPQEFMKTSETRELDVDEKYMELAGELAEAEVTQALQNAGRRALPDTLLTPDQYKRLDCEECGADLPEFRMQRGLEICTECKTAMEKARKNYAGYRT